MTVVELDHIIQSPTPQGIRIAAQSLDINPNIADFGGNLNPLVSPAYSPISRDDFWEVFSLQYFKSGNSVFTFQQLTLDQSNRASSQNHAVIIPNNLLKQINLFSLSELIKSDGQGNKLNTYKTAEKDTIQTLNKLSVPIEDITFDKTSVHTKLNTNDLIAFAGNIFNGNKLHFSLNKNNIGTTLAERSDTCRILSFIIFYLLLALDKPISFSTYLPIMSIINRYDLLLTYVTKYSPGEDFKSVILGQDKLKINSDLKNKLSKLLTEIQNNNWNYTKSIQEGNET